MKDILKSLCLWCTAGVLLCSCQTANPSLSGYVVFSGEMPEKSQPISQEFILIADNQTSNVYSKPVSLFRSPLMDQIEDVAIRPIQLDYFGKYILTDIVFPRAGKKPVIHLGDAANFGCTGEFTNFLSTMKKYEGEWYMLPGNHDVSFMGNAILNNRKLDKLWKTACFGAGEPMKKNEFIYRYLASLSSRDNEVYRRFKRESLKLTTDETDAERLTASMKEGEASRSGEVRFDTKDPGVPLRALKWNMHDSRQWKSYMVQAVDMGCSGQVPEKRICVQGILFDTTEYDTSFLLTALTAHIGDDQFDAVKKWLKEAKDANSGNLTIFMGHHPFHKLTRDSQEKMDALRKEFNALLYVSADIHLGQYFVHGEGKDTWLELNLGSVTDWPAEMRTLQVFEVGDKAMVSSPRISIGDELKKEAGISFKKTRQWEVRPGHINSYLRHREIASIKDELDAVRTEIEIKDSLLHTHRLLLDLYPTEESTQNPPCPARETAHSAKECDRHLRDEIRQSTNAPIPETREEQDAVFTSKDELLMRLAGYDEKRVVSAAHRETMRTYRLAQIYWASKSEYFGARKPDRDDCFIVTPVKAMEAQKAAAP